MTKTPKKKSTYKETLINFIESAKMDGLSEEEANTVLNGYVLHADRYKGAQKIGSEVDNIL